jgi:aldehyde dehydrogenase (NAD+)
MRHAQQFYIGGEWVEPATDDTLPVVNPATEEVIATIAMGSQLDVDAAVAAASAAFEGWSTSSVGDRLALLDRIIEIYKTRMGEIGAIIRQELGAPAALALHGQAGAGLVHFRTVRRVLAEFEFECASATTLIVREPVGVCGLITPWNWPINQIACKVAPALAAGCTMVLKPSEVAPLNAVIFTEVLGEAGVPAGVFNLVHGDGPTVGAALSSHPDVDMVSFTGSTRAGVDVARNAAPTVKRVAQELGGKSANVILDDADFDSVIRRDVEVMCRNSGQSCNAPSRMLVPAARMDEAARIAADAARNLVVGDPGDESTQIGPVVSAVQFDRIQRLIESGLAEGARLEAGGPGLPEGVSKGYFVRPTVFSHVTNQMTIAREEIFGPVMVIIGYEDDADAVRIANDTDYGLSGYISGDIERARAMARRLRTGNVHLNGAPGDLSAPFGGFKQSGNGREWGEFGLLEFLETKAVLGFGRLPFARDDRDRRRGDALAT